MQEPTRGPRILAVTSGKGGVGKTTVAVNLSVCLRLLGAELLLLDADMGLANVDVLLGLRTIYNLRDVLLKHKSIPEVIAEGPAGLKILPGVSGVQGMGLTDEAFAEFLLQLQRYCRRMAFVVVDTAAGIAPSVINYLLAADEVLLVTSPDPLAITDAYALLKVMRGKQETEAPKVSVIMNQANREEEAQRAFERLRRAAERFLGWQVRYLGPVACDETVRIATKRQVAFQTQFSTAPCSRDIRSIATRLVNAGQRSGVGVGSFFRRMMEFPGKVKRAG